MFHSFTGSSRRPRQVNLSGRNPNPFANAGLGPGSSTVLASAQQERIQRQREREKLTAIKTIQRSWRGYKSRRLADSDFRDAWDATEADDQGSGDSHTEGAYKSESTSYVQLLRLLRFVRVQDAGDLERLHRYCRRQMLSVQASKMRCTGDDWEAAFTKLQRVILRELDFLVMSTNPKSDPYAQLDALRFSVHQAPTKTARNADQYFAVMNKLIHHFLRTPDSTHARQESLLDAITTPLKVLTATTDVCYVSFACKILTLSELSQDIDPEESLSGLRYNFLNALVDSINYKILARALSNLVEQPNLGDRQELAHGAARIRLLCCFIYFHRRTYKFQSLQASSTQSDFVSVVSYLLPSLGYMNFDEMLHSTSQENDEQTSDATDPTIRGFLREQIFSLINQESVGSLLFDATATESSSENENGRNDKARQLANYALTLLRCFPRRADEIRMWLFIGSSSASAQGAVRNLPVIKYFWKASKDTTVFKIIFNRSRDAIKLIKPRSQGAQHSWQTSETESDLLLRVEDEWRLLLIFMELYTFVLKVMDDVEFFSPRTDLEESTTSSNWTRDNALPLNEVKDLTIFLKNLGFTMYFNAAEIAEDQKEDSGLAGISSYFNVSPTSKANIAPRRPRSPGAQSIGGVAGVSIEYARGLVTGLLRMIYERDSRQRFLLHDHWLMTSRFDMDGFIPGVVAEEENRHRVQEEDDDDLDSGDNEEDDNEYSGLVGTTRILRARNVERLQRQQRKASRKRYLLAVTPRLAILQNMPFFIPFTTRVEIFRHFVHLDQLKRRNGLEDAETWRMLMASSPVGGQAVEKHHARIRRKYELDDAYEQFYPLKEGLKEPIQITFVDQFDQVEAGIDGGGVTKEFLTSVTDQAFSPSDGLDLFIENDQHLLLPNPAALEEKKDMLRQAGFDENSQFFRSAVTDLLQRYEFLGRIIGKCLYEGILVDINFAGFFLLKWALTGGTGSAPKESGYRANLNDLKDLDDSLFKGLLQLKNYPGNVEDFSLNFTVTDVFTTNYKTGATKTITRELKPGGASIPVTNENRLVYISYMARHRLQIQPYAQTNAFLRGLSSMIQPTWLSMFNQSELQTLIAGTSSSINIADLRRNTQYGGIYVIGDDGREHPSIQLFWQVLDDLAEDEKRAVLKFVTSTPRAPLLGFSSLNPRFSIRDSGSDQERLPSTSTCVNLLKLPAYKSPSVLKEKLLYSVLSGAGFDLS